MIKTNSQLYLFETSTINRKNRFAKKEVGDTKTSNKMPKYWTVRLKRTISPSVGLVEGFKIQVMTQQNCHDYPSLYNALADAGFDRSCGCHVGGCLNDTYWEWT